MKTFSDNDRNPFMHLECVFCGERFKNLKHLGLHKMRYHNDTWAAIELLDAGVSEDDARHYYDKCMNQTTKKFGVGRKKGSGMRRSDALSVRQEECIFPESVNQEVRSFMSNYHLDGQDVFWNNNASGESGEYQNDWNIMEDKEVKIESDSWIVNEEIFDDDVRETNETEIKLEEEFHYVDSKTEYKGSTEDMKEEQALTNDIAQNDTPISDTIVSNNFQGDGDCIEDYLDSQILMFNENKNKRKLFQYLDTNPNNSPEEEEKRFNLELQQLFGEIDEMLGQRSLESC